MNKIKKIFHKLPDGFQLKVISLYNKIWENVNYLRYHSPIEKKVKNFLGEKGITGIKRFGHGWRMEPIFSQYYTGYYEGDKVFCKVYRMPDFGCIEREKRTLQFIASTGDGRLINAVPKAIASYQTEDIRILITEYIEGKPLKESNILSQELYNEFRKIWGGLSDNGIIHVDIRPENFIILEDNIVKLIDFGMAYVKKYEKEDELYRTRVFPAALWGTGCKWYNPVDGRYDDAYAMLRTLKDIDPRFIRTCREGWMEFNRLIGSMQIYVECEKW